MSCLTCPHKIYHEKHKERDRRYADKRRTRIRKLKLKSYYKHRDRILAKMRARYKKTGVWNE